MQHVALVELGRQEDQANTELSAEEINFQAKFKPRRPSLF